MDLLHINIFYQHVANYLLNLILHLFFQIQNCYYEHFVWMFWNIWSLLIMLFYFVSIVIKINHLNLLSISLSHILKASAPYVYVVILSKVCNILSPSLLSAILLVSSAHTQCAHFLALFCCF